MERPALSNWAYATRLSAVAIALVAVGWLTAPLFHDLHAFGQHDWDSHSAYRYITVLALKKFHEPPWWQPWLCGGYPAWGYVEGATNLISPFLPAYLILPIQVAVRVEVVGTALIGLGGAYLLAGRFTKSVAVRLTVSLLFALNGRWALQAAGGHTWHLQYAYMPVALFLFDTSLENGRLNRAVWAGGVIALMVYVGAIYPVPHVALSLVLYASMLAVGTRSWRPFVALSITGFTSLGFSAPKLFPVIDTASQNRRLIASPEFLDLGQLTTVFTDKNQVFGVETVNVPSWGWHEYGIYIGWLGVIVLILGLLLSSGTTGNAVKVLGLLFLVLGMGAFHPKAPWSLLHAAPVFSSQHVPSRFLYPSVLFLGLAFASAASRIVDPIVIRRPWVDLVLLSIAAYAARDITSVGRKSFTDTFQMAAPDIHRLDEFEQLATSRYRYIAGKPWAEPILLAMFANTGSLACYGIPDIEKGAVPKGAPQYRGQVYVVNGTGSAKVNDWTPNHATVAVKDASPGALLVYNMNYDVSWKENGNRALEWNHAVAAPLATGDSNVAFRYTPRTLKLGTLVFAVTLALSIYGPRWRRRKRPTAMTHERSSHV